MPAGRRHPPAVPNLDALIRDPGPNTPLPVFVRSVRDALRQVANYLSKLQDGFSGAPTPHADTHLVGGSDALQTPGTPRTVLVGSNANSGNGPSFMREDAQLVVGAGTPTHPTGQNAASGSATTVMRSDATIQQGIVTTKGDLLTFGTLPDRLSAGVDGEAVVYEASQTQGLRKGSAWKGARLKTLTNNTVTGLFEVALAAGAICGGSFTYTIRVINAGGDLQVESGHVTFAATNKGGVYATDIDKGTNSTPTPTAGTLAVTFSIVTGASKVTISVNANSSLTPTTQDARFVLDSLDANAVTFL
jgi:hypothetical protein